MINFKKNRIYPPFFALLCGRFLLFWKRAAPPSLSSLWAFVSLFNDRTILFPLFCPVAHSIKAQEIAIDLYF